MLTPSRNEQPAFDSGGTAGHSHRNGRPKSHADPFAHRAADAEPHSNVPVHTDRSAYKNPHSDSDFQTDPHASSRH